ncbi:Glu/Leu/Phe/Val dehydrogenase dimerization domain-containing protein [Alicyclobacillus tolerans]|uniref:Leucine dehydrogenase n=2 Tax=Alicyclobacillus tolerans TaxID=90970 RepID=A0ABT9LWQ7_9BACL|nr:MULTISPECIES: Glu/Leu/Phe/Val dehydrogenase dimerization domain-containing protein [Alicyclobacillus]MDP9728708.1 leucine dehydrogenase [Alicyclobacillus tengchongensis]QRF23272.1 Glu/Leu/Phe/Val dehydrogenase [Alicyclobacillus sp. TC]SHK40903.1 leucine dehydrogenase [Alicyclobacillus montanus]
MEIFQYLQTYDYEQVVFCHDEASGLKAIIAIHDTTLGPALGGCRMWPYATEEEAILDALRLARGMTYKAAAAGLNLGGGKTVIIGDAKKDKSEALFRALGRYIQSLNGRYITAEDVGTTEADMNLIHMETKYVTGISKTYGSSGNPSPMTALGVFRGMQATAKLALGSDDLAGKTVAIQGLGSVGYALAEMVKEAGGHLVVTDINEDALKRAQNELGAKVVGIQEIFEADCDILAPCALGAVLNDHTLPLLKCKAIAGSANNQLAETRHGDWLHERGILYAPDYVINSGGVINVADELEGYSEERAKKRVEGIYNIMLELYEVSRREHIPSYQAADRMAEARIEQMRRVRSTFLPHQSTVLHK